MPLAPIIAAAAVTAGHPDPAYSLTVGGLSVLKQPRVAGSSAQLYGVEQSPIAIEHAGPGGVSGIEFTIDDPLGVVRVEPGMIVRYVRWTAGEWPEFLGVATAPTFRPWPPLGRYIDVKAIGMEAVLDWSTVPAVTFDGTSVPWTAQAAIQSLCGLATWGATGIGVIGGTGLGSVDAPLGTFGNAAWTDVLTIGAGTTLRSAIAAVLEHARPSLVGDEAGSLFSVTIDMRGRLAGWHSRPGHPEDNPYSDLTVDDGVGSIGEAFADLEHTVDGGAIVRQVRVTGGSAAGSGVFGDDSGLPGITVAVTDTTSLTQAAARAIAAGILRPSEGLARGSGRIEWGNALTPTASPGCRLVLTDDIAGATGEYRVSEITKGYVGRSSVWTVSYGALPPSLVNNVRLKSTKV